MANDPKTGSDPVQQPSTVEAPTSSLERPSTEDLSTGAAPPYRSLVRTDEVRIELKPTPFFEPGLRIDDFEILRLLGEGAFAKVFLARQISLDRQVALKVSANRGSEARTLASLEHAHIVQVFSEIVDRERDLRMLCMQYVPGTTLDRILRSLRPRDPGTWSGRAILETLDALSTHKGTFDPAALRDRELLGQADFVTATCWIGARLVEALAYAHSQGILHRDIKPANILVNPYGRPMLADFNLALDPQHMEGKRGETFGGTLAYMAPEHLDAFNPEEATSPEAVDERSDLFALGVVLFEMLTGKRPFDREVPDQRPADALRTMAAERRQGAPSLRIQTPGLPEVVDRVLRRCLDPEPGRRYQTAAELARALEGCRELLRVEQELPAPGPVTRAALLHPFLWLAVLALVPQLLGSVLNISYNSLQIVGGLSEAQQRLFHVLVLVYNLVTYPLCLWLAYRQIMPVYRTWRAVTRSRPLGTSAVAETRGRLLSWPLWAVGLSCLGWLPGGVLFPLGLHFLSDAGDPVRISVFGHFLLSFWISGLIALTYSYFAVQFIVLRVLYPQFWIDAQELRSTAARELVSVRPRLWFFQLLAGLIPLSGAAMMVGLGPEAMSYTFRLLITLLILLGMTGLIVAITVTGLLTETLTALTGSERRQDQR